MCEYGLIAKRTRRYYRYQANKTSYGEKDNILLQVFSVKPKNEIWVEDITYIPAQHGWLYLTVFIDIFSRKAVGWAMDTQVRDTLVCSALNQAIGREYPPKELIIHTECSRQYAAQRFQALCIR